MFGASANDRDFLPQLAEEGWVVVSADRGKNSAKSDRLPLICVELRITHVLFSRGAHKLTTFGKYRAIIDNWEDLAKTADAPKGSGYSIRRTSGEHGKTILVHVASPSPMVEPGGQMLLDLPKDEQ